MSLLESFNDGTGPALYAAGDPGVWKWNGQSWARLGTISGVGDVAVANDGSGVTLYAISGLALYRWRMGSWQQMPPVSTGGIFPVAIAGRTDGEPALHLLIGYVGDCCLRGAFAWNGAAWSPVGSWGGLPEHAGPMRRVKYVGGRWYVFGYGQPIAGLYGAPGCSVGGCQLSIPSCEYQADVRAMASVEGSGPVGTYAAGCIAGLCSTSVPARNIIEVAPVVQSIGLGMPPTVAAMVGFDPGSGGRLYAGGAGVFASWDGVNWTSLATISGTVQALVVHDDGTGPAVYGAGSFSSGGSSMSVGRWAPACRANCDQSTVPPALNVLDFGCFLNKFAHGDSAANCDCSTAPPILTVEDFTCFMNHFLSGC